jgi:hypothetical protein
VAQKACPAQHHNLHVRRRRKKKKKKRKEEERRRKKEEERLKRKKEERRRRNVPKLCPGSIPSVEQHGRDIAVV